ncbi:MAG: Mu-like prophage major head subunit gpT family protein [Deltaproteobacteria bacterium]|nr:Mu-like prophage major head subunit gpT family protein [Deltaproteobacteria bacterium]
MLVTAEALAAIYQNLRTVFVQALDDTQTYWQKVAMLVPSSTRQETYGWLKSLPGLRKWIGDRLVKSLETAGYTIVNEPWEATIGVLRDDIEDDQLGIYKPIIEELARAGKTHPDELIFDLLKNGFTNECHDGQPFFDTDHPDGKGGVWSNFGGGSGTAWYLLDVSRSLKPLIFQQRKPLDLETMDQPDDPNVFMRREFLYGVDARHNVGYGLPQLAYASKDSLNGTNYAAARAAMMSLKNEEDRPLNILGAGKPLLVVPPTLEADARKLLQNEKIIVGETSEDNPWKGTAELLIVPWLG